MIRTVEMKTVREFCIFCHKFHSRFQFTAFQELYDSKYTHKNEFKNICDCINLQGFAAPTHCPLNHVV